MIYMNGEAVAPASIQTVHLDNLVADITLTENTHAMEIPINRLVLENAKYLVFAFNITFTSSTWMYLENVDHITDAYSHYIDYTDAIRTSGIPICATRNQDGTFKMRFGGQYNYDFKLNNAAYVIPYDNGTNVTAGSNIKVYAIYD